MHPRIRTNHPARLRRAARGLCLLAAAAVTFTTLAAEASILPAIDSARDLREEEENTGPVLRKHYVEVSPGVFLAVKGARERRQVRIARWVDGLAGDRAAVFAEEGFPVFRHRELEADRVTEHWTYPESGFTYVFEGDTLLRRTR